MTAVVTNVPWPGTKGLFRGMEKPHAASTQSAAEQRIRAVAPASHRFASLTHRA